MKLLLSITISLISFSSFAQNKGPTQIIGEDTRVRVTDTNAKSVHNSMGLLLLKYSDGTSMCTGTVVGTRQVITAAHCLYNIKTEESVQEVRFYPGLRDHYSKGKFPFGVFSAKFMRVNPAYKIAGDTQEDYALLTFLENLPVAAQPLDVLNLKVASISIAGYPADKTLGELWEGTGIRYAHKSNPFAENHSVDTIGGQSGSAVRYGNKIVGIHSGAITYGAEKSNVAFFFTEKTLETVKNWIKAD